MVKTLNQDVTPRKGVSQTKPIGIAFYLKLASSIFIAFLVVYTLAPGWRSSLIAEDQLVENLTSLVCLVAFLGAAFQTSRLRRGSGRRLGIWVAIAALIAFLDEVSFGVRFFGVSPIQMESGYQVDGVHDVIGILKSVTSRTLYNLQTQVNPDVYAWISKGLKVALPIALALGLFWVFKKHHSRLRKLMVGIRQHRPSQIALASLGLAVLAQVPDTLELHIGVLSFVEEIFELNAAVGLLLTGFALRQERRREEQAIARAEYAQRDEISIS